MEGKQDVRHQKEAVKRKQKSATVQNENQHKHSEKNCELKVKRKKKSLGPLVSTQTIENSSLSKISVDKKSENKLTQNVSKSKRSRNKKPCVPNGKIGSCCQDHAVQSPLSEKQKSPNKNDDKPKDFEPGHALPSSDESGSKPLSKAKKRRLRKKRILQVLGLANKQVVPGGKSRKKRRKKCGDSDSNIEDKASDSSNLQTEFSSLSNDISTRNLLFEQNSDIFRNIHKANNICSHITSRRPITEDTCLNDCDGHLYSALRNSYSQGNTLPNCTASDNYKSVSENILVAKRKQKKEKQVIVSSNNSLSSEPANGILFDALQNDVSLSLNSGNKVKKSPGLNDSTVEKGKPIFESVSKLPKSKEKDKKVTVSNQSLTSVETSSCGTATKVSGKTSENTLRSLPDRKKEPISKGFSNISEDNTDSLNVRVHTLLPENEGKIIKSPLCDTELPSALSLQRSVLISGPIYTSPNLENRVTSSAESNQIFNNSKTSSVLSSSICSAAPVRSKESDNSNVKIQNTKSTVPGSKSLACCVESSAFCVNEHLPLTDKKCEKTLLEEKAVLDKSSEKENHISVCGLKQSPLELQEISKEITVSSYEKKNLPLLTKKENIIVESAKDLINTPVGLVETGCDKRVSDNCLRVSSAEPLTMPKTDKTREEIKAEREARKLAKQAKKSKVVSTQKQPAAAQTNDDASTSGVTAEQGNVNDTKQTKKSNTTNTVQLQPTELAGGSGSKPNAAAVAVEKRNANDPLKLPDGTCSSSKTSNQSCVQVDNCGSKVNNVGEKPNKSDALKLADGTHPTVVSSSQSYEQVSDAEHNIDIVAQSPNSSDTLKLADGIHPAVINSSQSHVQAGSSGHKVNAIIKPNTSDALKLADGLHTSVTNSGQSQVQGGSSLSKLDAATSCTTDTERTNASVSLKSIDGINLTQHISAWSELKTAANESKLDVAGSEHPNASDSLKLVDGIPPPQQTSSRPLIQTGSSSSVSGVATEQTNTSDALKLVDGTHPTLQTTNCVDASDVASGIQAAMAQINDHKARKLPQQSVPVQKRINASDDEKVKERSVILKQKTENPVAAPSTDGKSKAELRAERRAKQEAQRAAKLQNQQRKSGDQKDESKNKTEKPTKISKDKQPAPAKSTTTTPVSKVIQGLPDVQHKVKLFNHLYLRQKESISAAIGAEVSLHPAIVRLGIQYKSRVVTGSNARCVALLHAIKQVIEDYHTPSQQEFSRGLESSLRHLTTYLHACRPLSVSATNALRHLKWQLTLLPNNVTDSDAKKKLHDSVDTYIREQIDVAGQAICNAVLDKITNGDTILTYGCSSLLTRILLKAHDSGKRFHVVVADGRPWLEGREMLRRLVKHGLKCSYVLLPAASFIMREATKVLLGAHALLANGYVMSRAGASQIALLAHAYNVPVLVCCETHKFSERVQTDSFVYNELGDPNALGVRGWHEVGCLTPLNLTYDVTPPDLVTAVVTELAILPCTSVPVILRIKPSEAGF